ncbi:MAG: hypothetical protein K0B06_02495 [Brevefilum sp.]|nr:hypothetical protein [Brevefilum sp.]
MRFKLLLCLLCLSLLISGCDILTEIPLPPSETPVSTPTPISPEEIIPSATLPAYPPQEPTPDPLINAVFTLQPGGPFYLPNFNHPEEGCNWLGVAGQVFDENGLEILNLTILAGNRLAGEDILAATTGEATAYGLGGYEIKLSSQPVNTSNLFWVQVVDSAGQSLSQRIFFDTFEDCEQNLALVNFIPLEAQNLP